MTVAEERALSSIERNLPKVADCLKRLLVLKEAEVKLMALSLKTNTSSQCSPDMVDGILRDADIV